eukprot:tig00021073_g18016.t1
MLSQLNNDVSVPSKVLAVFGKFEAYGVAPTRSWTRLARNGKVGDSSIVIESAIAKVNDTIVIAPSDWSFRESQEFVALAVSTAGDGASTLTLNKPLAHQVWGTKYVINRKDGTVEVIDMRNEVAVLTRSVVIRGANPSPVNPKEELFGAGLLVGKMNQFSDMGQLYLDGIAFQYFGQNLYDSYGVFFDRMGKVVKGSATVRRCTFRDGYTHAIYVRATSGAVVEDNVVFNAQGPNLLVDEVSFGFTLNNNLMIGSRILAGDDLLRASTLHIMGSLAGSTVVGNVVAGSERRGLNYVGQPCSTSVTNPSLSEHGVFANNTVHSAIIGLDLLNAKTFGPCVLVQGLTIYKNFQFHPKRRNRFAKRALQRPLPCNHFLED